MSIYIEYARKIESDISEQANLDYKEFIKYLQLYLYGRNKEDNLGIDNIALHLNAYKGTLHNVVEKLTKLSKNCGDYTEVLGESASIFKEAAGRDVPVDTFFTDKTPKDAVIDDNSIKIAYQNSAFNASKRIVPMADLKKNIDDYIVTLNNVILIAGNMFESLNNISDDTILKKIVDQVSALNEVKNFNVRVIDFQSKYDNSIKDFQNNSLKRSELPNEYIRFVNPVIDKARKRWGMLSWKRKTLILVTGVLIGLALVGKDPLYPSNNPPQKMSNAKNTISIDKNDDYHKQELKSLNNVDTNKVNKNLINKK